MDSRPRTLACRLYRRELVPRFHAGRRLRRDRRRDLGFQSAYAEFEGVTASEPVDTDTAKEFHRRMLVATGQGKVVVPGGAPTGGIRAGLVNFDIDGDAPKAEHKAFIDAQAVPLLRQPNSICILRGEASHTGTDAHNLDLSKRRANNVLAYLVSRGIPVNRVKVQLVGESLAGNFLGESANARGVSLLVARTAPIPQLTPAAQPAPALKKTTTQFKLRMLGGLSSGIGIAQIEKLFSRSGRRR